MEQMATTARPPDASSSMATITAKLYGLRGAAPSCAAELMLRHKSIRYRRVNLSPIRQRRQLAKKGFPGPTVPAMVIDGQHVQTNRAIARSLDRLVPDPALFPADPAARAKVEEAEGFVDEEFQPMVRRMILWSMTKDPRSVRPHPANGRIQVPRIAWVRARVMPRFFSYYGISEEVIREHYKSLPAMLDRLDGYVGGQVLGDLEPNAADFQVAPLLGALTGIPDLNAEIAWRPSAGLVKRILPG
jgi:glutathione S-transferase